MRHFLAQASKADYQESDTEEIIRYQNDPYYWRERKEAHKDD